MSGTFDDSLENLMLSGGAVVSNGMDVSLDVDSCSGGIEVFVRLLLGDSSKTVGLLFRSERTGMLIKALTPKSVAVPISTLSATVRRFSVLDNLCKFILASPHVGTKLNAKTMNTQYMYNSKQSFRAVAAIAIAKFLPAS